MLQTNRTDRREYGTNGETRSLAEVAAELRLELGDRDSVVIHNCDDPEYRAGLARRARALSGTEAPANTLPSVKEWRAKMNHRLDQIGALRESGANARRVGAGPDARLLRLDVGLFN